MTDGSVKAEWARQIITDPQFLEMFEEMRQQAYADIRNSNPQDQDGRELLYQETAALDRIEAKLQSYLDNQKITEHRIKE